MGQSQLAEMTLAGRLNQTRLKRIMIKSWCNWAVTLRLVSASAYLSLFPKLTVVLRNAINCLLPPRQVCLAGPLGDCAEHTKQHSWVPSDTGVQCVFSESHISTQRFMPPACSNMFSFILLAHKPESSVYLKL